MTRDEAIDIIKSECYVFNPFNFDRSTIVNTALDMAIKALEQEPCDDAVNRKAVSSWLKQYGQDVLHGKYKFSLMYIWKNLMDLPSAQPATNCSEIPNNSDTISRQAAIDAPQGQKVRIRNDS